MHAPKAAAVIIGNEVLSGKVQDVNVHTLGRPPLAWTVKLNSALACDVEPSKIRCAT